MSSYQPVHSLDDLQPLAHLQGHERYQGGSEGFWAPHHTHTHTHAGCALQHKCCVNRINRNNLQQWVKPGCAIPLNPNIPEPSHIISNHAATEWRNCMCEYNHFEPDCIPVVDFYAWIQQWAPRAEKRHKRRKANTPGKGAPFQITKETEWSLFAVCTAPDSNRDAEEVMFHMCEQTNIENPLISISEDISGITFAASRWRFNLVHVCMLCTFSLAKCSYI